MTRLHESAGQSGLIPAEVATHVAHDAARQWQAFLKGLWLYQHHPAQHVEGDWRVVSQTAAVALKRLGPLQRNAAPILLVPSLINRFHILDLHPDYSFAQHLRMQGHDVFLLDWHHDIAQPMPASLESCVADHLLPALRTIKRPAHMIGYCMGGTLAVQAAIRLPERMRSLTLLATPWDFHRPAPDNARRFAAWIAQMIETGRPHIQAEWLQMLFWQRDPLAALRKFQSFAAKDMQGLEAALFTLAEDWLNQGVDLPATLLQDCAQDWFAQNRPAAQNLSPLRHIPVQIITATRDRLVPRDSAEALRDHLPHAHSLTFDTGHIGLFAGTLSQRNVWPHVQHFLAGHNP